jgi:septum formation topological specificity factor MinE
MTRKEMLRAFDEACATPRRGKHNDPDVVKRLRKDILEGWVIYDPIKDRVEHSSKAHARAASINMHLEGGNA